MEKVVKNGLYISIFTALSIPASFFVRLILSHELSLAEFGFFYALIGFFDLIQSFNDFGFSEAQVYFIPKFIAQGRLDKIKATIKVQLINQIVTTGVMGLAIIFGSHWIARHIFHFENASATIALFVVYFICKDFLLNIRNLFFAYQDAKVYGAQEVIRIFLTVSLLVIGMQVFPLNLTIAVVVWIIVHAMLAIAYTYVFAKKYAHVFSAPSYPLKNIYKEFFPILLPTLVANKAGVLFGSGTETLLAIFKGVVDVGLYNVAKPIANLSLAIVAPFADVLKPYISEIDELRDYHKVQKLITMILNAGTFILLPFTAALMFYSKESIVFLFGIKFIAAAPILKLISIEVFLLIMNSFVYGIVFGLGLQKKRAINIYIASSIALLLSLILIPRFGPVGVALTNIGYSFFMVISGLYIIYNKVRYVLPIKNFFLMGFLVLIFILSQYIFKMFTSESSAYQFLLFSIKASIGFVIYYVLGIFVFKLIDIPFLIKNVSQNIPPSVRRIIGKYTR